MRPRWLAAPCAAIVLMAGCDSTGPDVEQFAAILSGTDEVPPRTTTAAGRTDFTVEEDGSVSFSLEVTGIRNVVAAHIHGPATAGVNAGVVVTLFTSNPGTGVVNGTLREGSFTEPDRNAAGALVAPLDSVLAWMRSGRAYVNVHTNDGADPPNTGAGDFPGGEIRGQIAID